VALVRGGSLRRACEAGARSPGRILTLSLPGSTPGRCTENANALQSVAGWFAEAGFLPKVSVPPVGKTSNWVRVSRARPCPICKADGWCSVTGDGAVAKCMKVEEGCWRSGTDKNGVRYYLHRLKNPVRPNSVSPPSPTDSNVPRGGADLLDRAYSALLSLLHLLPRHREALKRRGLADAEIDRCGYRTFGTSGRAARAKALRAELGDALLSIPGFVTKKGQDGEPYLTIAGAAGLLVPVRDPAGRIVALLSRRDDEPRQGGKYTYLSSARAGGPSPGAPPHVPLGVTVPCPVCRLTEGALKAHVAFFLSGLPTVGAAGLAWRPALDVLRQLGCQTVRLAFDADALDNPHVARALNDCADGAEEAGMAVELERWDRADGKGIDDLLAAGKVPDVLAGEAARAAIREALAASTAGDSLPGELPPGECGESGECVSARPEIVITTEEHEVNAQAAAVLARDSSLYQRGGMLARVMRDTSPAAGGIRRPFAPRIEPLPPALLRERLAANARWVTIRETQQGPQVVPARPPAWCVAAVHARADWPRVRHLEAVVDYPVLRPDGTILDCPGYDDATGLLLDFNGEPPLVPPAPSYREALDARDALLEVVADFPFEQECHRGAWLAGLLTPLARFAFTGPAPLFLVDANVRGAGKGLLLDCISRIINGERFTVATYTSDEDELRKRITSLALAGDRLVLFDNLEGRFGNATLDAALTATSWEDRILGVNRIARAPLFVTWYATGNNVALGADTARRVCHVRLESPDEKPEERGGFAHPDLLAHVAANRPRLLGAALTILRAYFLAGRPQRELRPWGSFQGWSGLVRGAVVWVGLPDPGETRYLLQAQADITAEAMSLLLCCWEQMDPDRKGLTAAEVIDRLFKRPQESPPAWHAEMRAAVESLVGCGDSRALGNRLRSFRRRIFRGRFIDQAGTEHRAARWVVRPASEFRRPTEKDSPDSHDSPFDAAGGGEPGESCESGESFSANGRAGGAHGNDSEVL
jgi:hypothetical protein